MISVFLDQVPFTACDQPDGVVIIVKTRRPALGSICLACLPAADRLDLTCIELSARL
jgi:hypothetical protein